MVIPPTLFEVFQSQLCEDFIKEKVCVGITQEYYQQRHWFVDALGIMIENVFFLDLQWCLKDVHAKGKLDDPVAWVNHLA